MSLISNPVWLTKKPRVKAAIFVARAIKKCGDMPPALRRRQYSKVAKVMTEVINTAYVRGPIMKAAPRTRTNKMPVMALCMKLRKKLPIEIHSVFRGGKGTTMRT